MQHAHRLNILRLLQHGSERRGLRVLRGTILRGHIGIREFIAALLLGVVARILALGVALICRAVLARSCRFTGLLPILTTYRALLYLLIFLVECFRLLYRWYRRYLLLLLIFRVDRGR